MLKQTQEDDMTKLNALNLVAYERTNNSDPKLQRRRKLLTKLQEQVKLAEDSAYQPMTKKWVMDADGERKRVDVPKRVKQWWGRDANGDTVLTVRYGSKPLELAKGKQAIKLASNDDVVKTLQLIAEAVEAGELDSSIEQHASMQKRKTKAK
ncbi:MAG: hypothetical protein CMM46_17780 [Rhodospirillaceae bacterium]|nr:hypothetical protein [Rhodospirillaceae bacterium]|tara:strand:+ start:2178 stop:2633 length:456 start_codon:yes stop_codon:yes gene_type:complete